MQCNLHEQELTLLRTTHNARNWFYKGRQLLGSLGSHQSFKPNEAAHVWEDVFKTDLGVIKVYQFSQENGYRPFGTMVITNEGTTDPQSFHGFLSYIDEILVEKAGILYRLSYSEIAIDSEDESVAGAFRKYAVPKRIDLVNDAYWFDPNDNMIKGFNPDPNGNQYFKGRKKGIHFNTYPKDSLALHYEMRLQRRPLHKDNINTLPALLKQAPDLVAKRLFFMAPRPGAAPDLAKRSSAEAYTALSIRLPQLTKEKIRKQFFDDLPHPNIPQPIVANIYNNPISSSSLQPSSLSHENTLGNKASQIFEYDNE